MGESFAHGHALIIGTGEGIENVIDDANGLAALLQDPERCAYPAAQVQTLTGADATRAAILHALDALALATSTESTVVVYFSGHGYEALTPTGRDYYLLPSDAREDQLPTTTLHGSEFVAKLAAIPAQKMLILLDCCHAGGLGDWEAAVQLTKAPMPPEARDLLAKGAGRVLIASSRAHEVSFAAGRGEPYSKFTAALLEALCGEGNARRDGFVRVADLASYASEQVPARTRQRQHPLLNFEHADNFAVAYYASGDARPKALPFARSHEPPPSQGFPRRIPAPPLEFTGREADLRQWLSEADHQRGFVLHGLGGAGKSALAFRLAEALAPRYPNAQLYVDLQDKHRKPLTPVQAMTLVIRAFRPDFVAGRAPPERLSELYRDCLSDGGHLLLFDNARSEKQLDLLMEAKDCFILVTSHRRLALRGMLSCPVDVLPPAQARALLLKIAPRLGLEQAEAVAEACGYMPYALCLTASRLQQRPNLDPADYARRLRDWSQQLDLVPASLTETYRQLSKARQAQFCALAAFPREFDQTVAEMALDLSDAAVMEALGELVECHLLEWNPAARPYHLHDAARAFAHSQKNARPDVIRRLRGVMKSKGRPEAARRTAGLWLTRLRWLDDVTTVPLGEFLAYLDLARQGTDSSTGLDYLERHITSALRRFDAALSPKHRAKLLVDRAALRGQLHRLDDAEKDYQAASKLAGNSGELAAQIALGAGNLVSIHGEQTGDREALRRAIRWYQQALALAQATKTSILLETSVGKELAYTFALLHQWSDAEAACAQAIAVLRARFQEVADPELAVQHFAMLLETASNVHFDKGRSKRPKTGPLAQREYESALHLIQEEIEMLTAARVESDALAVAYENAGDCLLALSQCEGGAASQREAACEMWKRAVDLAQRLGIHDIAVEDSERIRQHCSSAA